MGVKNDCLNSDLESDDGKENYKYENQKNQYFYSIVSIYSGSFPCRRLDCRWCILYYNGEFFKAEDDG